MNERQAYILLNMLSQVGPVRVRNLVERFGSAAAIFNAGESDLLEVRGIGPETARAIREAPAKLHPEKEERAVRALGGEIITRVDAAYPELLRRIPDPPLALYVLGTLEHSDRHTLAVVGSRRCTFYGRQVAERFSFWLARAGLTIVSGLARGIDACAHRAALKAGGRTIAVLGSGLDRIYPPESEELAHQIVTQGAVVSEYPLGREPDKTTFPYRNRVISGLSRGVLVVEAGPGSGALITADAALSQGRPVFAVPGRIDTPASAGCHLLIKQGARLVDQVDEILAELMQLELPAAGSPAAAVAEGDSEGIISLSDEEKRVLQALEEGTLDVDTLARRSGLSSGQLSRVLVKLEFKRAVRMLPGRLVEGRVRVSGAQGE